MLSSQNTKSLCRSRPCFRPPLVKSGSQDLQTLDLLGSLAEEKGKFDSTRACRGK